MTDPNRPARRCLCHKFRISVDRDDNGKVIRRICTATGKDLDKDQTYLATYGSEEPYQQPSQDAVQRGGRMD